MNPIDKARRFAEFQVKDAQLVLYNADRQAGRIRAIRELANARTDLFLGTPDTPFHIGGRRPCKGRRPTRALRASSCPGAG